MIVATLWTSSIRCCDSAVVRVRNRPMPEEVTRCALAAARHRAPHNPGEPRHRATFWAITATAASIALITLAVHFHAGHRAGDRAGTSPEPMIGEDIGIASANDLPTAWAYVQAARQSPEALEELLDIHGASINLCQSAVVGKPAIYRFHPRNILGITITPPGDRAMTIHYRNVFWALTLIAASAFQAAAQRRPAMIC